MKKILISGASGFLGKNLCAHFSKHPEYQLLTLVRREPKHSAEIFWDPYEKKINLARIEGLEAVIHLSGDNVGSGLWTSAKKKRMSHSRILTTAFLTESLLKLETPPRLFIGASGVGYYADGAASWIDENSPMDRGYFAELCDSWEKASSPLKGKGISVNHIRLGMVLSGKGGALASLKKIFKLYLGAVFGNGRQYMAWVHLEDVIGIISHVLEENVSGIINGTAPNPISNKEFTQALNKKLKRPTLLPVPAIAIKMLLGDMGKELFLKSLRVRSEVLETSGYQFKYPDFPQAIDQALQ